MEWEEKKGNGWFIERGRGSWELEDLMVSGEKNMENGVVGTKCRRRWMVLGVKGFGKGGLNPILVFDESNWKLFNITWFALDRRFAYLYRQDANSVQMLKSYKCIVLHRHFYWWCTIFDRQFTGQVQVLVFLPSALLWTCISLVVYNNRHFSCLTSITMTINFASFSLDKFSHPWETPKIIIGEVKWI